MWEYLWAVARAGSGVRVLLWARARGAARARGPQGAPPGGAWRGAVLCLPPVLPGSVVFDRREKINVKRPGSGDAGPAPGERRYASHGTQ